MKSINTTSILYLTLGWFGLQMAMALDTTQFQVMLDSYVQNAFFIGCILSLGPLSGIIVQPLIGWYGDVLTRKGISRELLMKIGLGIGLLSTLGLSLKLGLPALILCIALFYIAFNIVIVNYRAFVTETSTRKSLTEKKGTISGFVALFSGAGSFTMFALCSMTQGTAYPFWVAAILLLFTFFFFFRFAPRPKSLEPVLQQEELHSKQLFHRWNLLFYAMPLFGFIPWLENKISQTASQKHIFRLFMVLFFSWMGIQALRSYFVLYASKSLHLSLSTANILLAILTLVMLGVAIPLGKLADRYDNRLLLRYSLLFFSSVCFLAFFWVHSAVEAGIMSILLGASFAGMIVFPLSLLFKLCPAKIEGAYAGLYNLFIAMPQLFSIMMTGALIEITKEYHVILLVSGVSVLFGFLASFRLEAGTETLLVPALEGADKC